MIEKQLKELYIRYKLIIWPICTAGASAVILFFIIIPQMLSYLNVRGQISQLQTRVDSIDAKAQDLEQLDEQSVSRQFQSAFTVLPADPEIPSALVVLQGLADQAGVTIRNTTYSTSQGSNGKNSFILDLTVAGSISGMRTFLTSLQSAPRVFRVEAISAHFARNYSLEAEIPIAVYYEPSSAISWSVEQDVPKFSGKDEEFLNQLTQQVENANQRTRAREASYSAVPLGKLNLFD